MQNRQADADHNLVIVATTKSGLRVIPVKVECEYHKKGRGPITATAQYALPADKKDTVTPYTTLLRKTLIAIAGATVAMGESKGNSNEYQ